MKSIPLRSRSGNIIAEAIVDDDDFAIHGVFRWFLDSYGYARRTVNYKKQDGAVSARAVKLHRSVLGLGAEESRIVDHINRNRLDNRRDNLRLVTAFQSAANRGVNKNNKLGMRGISKRGNRYLAQLQIGRKSVLQELHRSLPAAIAARRHAELKYFGDYAPVQ